MAYYGTKKITAYYNGVRIAFMPYSYTGVRMDTLEALGAYSLANLGNYALKELR